VPAQAKMDEGEDGDDDDDDIEDEGERGAGKENSESLMKILKEVRDEMIRDKVKYEDTYYTEPLTPRDGKLMKLYLMTIGLPGKNSDNQPVKKKVLTAYIGASTAPTLERVHSHNIIGATHRNPRTKLGASRWTLCMVLFIPKVLRSKVSSKIIKHYWEAAHGRGKIKRGLLLQHMFGLSCFVPPAAKDIVRGQMPASKLLSFDKCSFKAPGIINTNKALSF